MRNPRGKRQIPSAAFTLAAVVFVLLSVAAFAADKAAQPADPDPFQQNKLLGRGVNVIGYDPLWRDRDRARFKVEFFKMIRDAGFGHVRINLHPFRDGRAGPDDKINPRWLDTLDWAVRGALDAKLMVVLDFHEFTEMAKDPQGKKARYMAAWRQIAERQRDAPSQVLFELLNEPNGQLTPELWNQLLREALAVVRKTNSTRTVIVGPGSWNNIGQLDKLDLPDEERNLVVTVHYYQPFDFTHQGAPWAGKKDKVGIPWNGAEQERLEVERDFDKAQAWAKKHHRPLYLGEFGAYDRAAMDSRVRWTSFVARQAEKRGWSWAYWQFDGDFILYDVSNNHWVEPIRDALVPAGK